MFPWTGAKERPAHLQAGCGDVLLMQPTQYDPSFPSQRNVLWDSTHVCADKKTFF